MKQSAPRLANWVCVTISDETPKNKQTPHQIKWPGLPFGFPCSAKVKRPSLKKRQRRPNSSKTPRAPPGSSGPARCRRSAASAVHWAREPIPWTAYSHQVGESLGALKKAALLAKGLLFQDWISVKRHPKRDPTEDHLAVVGSGWGCLLSYLNPHQMVDVPFSTHPKKGRLGLYSVEWTF